MLFRESKRTNEVLISVVVSEDYLLEEGKQTWIEERLTEMFKAGT